MGLLLQMPQLVSLPFIFRVLDCHCQQVGSWSGFMYKGNTGCKNFRQFTWCCVKWLFTFWVKLLPCIWITILLELIYVIKVVQYLISFPGWPARYWVWLTSTVLFLYQHTFLPISLWKLIICHGDDCFWSGIFFLTLPNLHFNFVFYQKWIC